MIRIVIQILSFIMFIVGCEIIDPHSDNSARSPEADGDAEKPSVLALLLRASKEQYVAIIEDALTKGENLDVSTDDGRNPAHFLAIAKLSAPTMRKVFNKYRNLSTQKNKAQHAPARVAGEHGTIDLNLLNVFIEYTCEIDFVLDNSDTLLHQFVSKQDSFALTENTLMYRKEPGMVDFLDSKNAISKTPFEMLCDKEHQLECKNLLQNLMTKINYSSTMESRLMALISSLSSPQNTKDDDNPTKPQTSAPETIDISVSEKSIDSEEEPNSPIENEKLTPEEKKERTEFLSSWDTTIRSCTGIAGESEKAAIKENTINELIALDNDKFALLTREPKFWTDLAYELRNQMGERFSADKLRIMTEVLNDFALRGSVGNLEPTFATIIGKLILDDKLTEKLDAMAFGAALSHEVAKELEMKCAAHRKKIPKGTQARINADAVWVKIRKDAVEQRKLLAEEFRNKRQEELDFITALTPEDLKHKLETNPEYVWSIIRVMPEIVFEMKLATISKLFELNQPLIQ